MRLRTAEGVLVPALFAYAVDEYGDEFFGEAWDEFFLWDAVPEDIDNSREFGTTFDPFFVFSFVPDAAVCVVLCAPGYPTAPQTGSTITGIEAAAAVEGVSVFHAGTKMQGDRLVTAGGRVLDVVAVAPTFATARDRAYTATEQVHWDGVFYRHDIGGQQT